MSYTHPETPSKWFPKFIKRYNDCIKNDADIPENKKESLYLKPLTFHQLRHTNASLLISKGIDISTVSARLGHSRISTTLDIYTHQLKQGDKLAADTMDSMFNNTSNSKVI